MLVSVEFSDVEAGLVEAKLGAVRAAAASLPQTLLMLRRMRGVSQDALGQQLEMWPSRWPSIERGEVDVEDLTFGEVARMLSAVGSFFDLKAEAEGVDEAEAEADIVEEAIDWDRMPWYEHTAHAIAMMKDPASSMLRAVADMPEAEGDGNVLVRLEPSGGIRVADVATLPATYEEFDRLCAQAPLAEAWEAARIL